MSFPCDDDRFSLDRLTFREAATTSSAAPTSPGFPPNGSSKPRGMLMHLSHPNSNRYDDDDARFLFECGTFLLLVLTCYSFVYQQPRLPTTRPPFIRLRPPVAFQPRGTAAGPAGEAAPASVRNATSPFSSSGVEGTSGSSATFGRRMDSAQSQVTPSTVF